MSVMHIALLLYNASLKNSSLAYDNNRSEQEAVFSLLQNFFLKKILKSHLTVVQTKSIQIFPGPLGIY